jgi:hypothetical protein
VMRRQFVEIGMLRDGLVEPEAEILETQVRGDEAVAKRRAQIAVLYDMLTMEQAEKVRMRDRARHIGSSVKATELCERQILQRQMAELEEKLRLEKAKERLYTEADLAEKMWDAELWRRAAESELDEIEGWMKARHPALLKQYWRERGSPVSLSAFGGTSQPLRPEERAGMGETTPTKVQRPDSMAATGKTRRRFSEESRELVV